MVTVRKVKELESENNSLKRTLKYMSHELLNVLTMVDYSVKKVNVQKESSNENGRYLDYLTEDVDYMIMLLKRLSDYNHSEELNKELCSLSKLVYDVVKEQSDKYSGKAEVNAKILGNDIDYYTMMDKCKIRQVMINMVKNAVEADAQKVEILVKKNKKNIVVEISDNGKGISKENIEKIFDEGVSINKKDGSGLGLAISKKIIESHGGLIKVKSVPNQKTTFILNIPC